MTAVEISAQWLAEAQSTRQRMTAAGGKAGLAKPGMMLSKTGLQQMQAMLAGEMPYPHIADTMDFGLIEIAEGRAVFQGTPQLKHYNPLGSVHGGWYGTLLDSCMGCAVHSAMPVGKAYTTAEYSINIVRAASHQSGPLRAIGTVLHAGKQLATAEGRIVGPDGKLYAHATTTCLVFDFPAR
jgi:uncharacterized protein (TIGR00369 family)